MISVIPDVHADAERLSATLARIDPESRIAFLGDLIDAGSKVRIPADRQILMSARGLIEDGRAVGIMGNHEINAILFYRLGPGGPLRERQY